MAKKVHIIIGLFGGLVDDVRIHEGRSGAKESYNEFLQIYARPEDDVRHLTQDLRR